MIRVILSILIYIGSLAAVLVSGSFISYTLAAYPAGHIRSFGPTVPVTSEMLAQWLPYARAALNWVALVSCAVAVYFWRSGRPKEIKLFAVTFVAAINYHLALFATLLLVIAYFLLPKVANGA